MANIPSSGQQVRQRRQLKVVDIGFSFITNRFSDCGSLYYSFYHKTQTSTVSANMTAILATLFFSRTGTGFPDSSLSKKNFFRGRCGSPASPSGTARPSQDDYTQRNLTPW